MLIKKDDILIGDITRLNVVEFSKRICPSCSDRGLQIVLVNKIFNVYCESCSFISALKYKGHSTDPRALNYDALALSAYAKSKSIYKSDSCMHITINKTKCENNALKGHLRCEDHYQEIGYRKFCNYYGIPYKKLDDLT
tara:strand:+ start:4248 stop:4664 length:417 start_codon:yes stop_codon:yes gene_type:complete